VTVDTGHQIPLDVDPRNEIIRQLQLQNQELQKRVKTLEEALLEKYPPKPIDWDVMAKIAEKESSELEARLLAGRELAHNVLTSAGVKPIYSSGPDQGGVATRIGWLIDERDNALRLISEFPKKLLEAVLAEQDRCAKIAEAFWDERDKLNAHLRAELTQTEKNMAYGISTNIRALRRRESDFAEKPKDLGLDVATYDAAKKAQAEGRRIPLEDLSKNEKRNHDCAKDHPAQDVYHPPAGGNLSQ
jgi:hypothetical protein